MEGFGVDLRTLVGFSGQIFAAAAFTARGRAKLLRLRGNYESPGTISAKTNLCGMPPSG
jgi:hypothetical protein